MIFTMCKDKMEEIIQVKKKLTNDKINQLWNETGHLSSFKFKAHLKRNHYEFSHKQIDDILKHKEILQLTHFFTKPTEYNTITSPSIRNNYQVDIMVYDRMEYKNYKYIFGCIDVYSRYTFCIPLKTHRGVDVLECFKKTRHSMCSL